jgi:hypothetical protein
MAEPKLIPLEDAKKLLADGTFVHVFKDALEGEEVEEFYLPKSKVINYFLEHGCELSGPEARKHQHGLCSMGKDGRYRYFQTKGPGLQDG